MSTSASTEGVNSSTKKFLDKNGLERYTNQIKNYFAGAELSETQPTKERKQIWNLLSRLNIIPLPIANCLNIARLSNKCIPLTFLN